MYSVLLALPGLTGVSQPTTAADARFVNISTRALVGTGEEVMVGGFIIEGGARRVLIQAIGPELADRGISNFLADPVLTVTNINNLENPVELMVNDDWDDPDTQGQLITDLWGGSPPLGANSFSSAAVLSLQPGNYTAKVEGKDGATGVAIVEVYEIDAPDADGRFVNLSTRALVGTGEEVMIGGFIIEGGERQVLIQAIGPELADRGISNFLANPVLTITNTTDQENPVELIVNHDWDDTQGQAISDLWEGNPPLAANGFSSAAVLSLQPGNYTAKVRELFGATGVAIVEVYEVDPPSAQNPEDRAALTALYNALDGTNWTNSTNWLTDAPLEWWHGVSTDDKGRIILTLFGNRLSGHIPVELGNLENLVSLDLRFNQLSGPIPVQLGNLANLEWLRLSSNQLSGPIPVQLANLENLRLLWLSDNLLSGPIPVELGNLANLEWLHLDENQLSSPFPVELTNLKKLTSLTLLKNDGLCVPNTAAFNTWLNGINWVSVSRCEN